MTTQAQLLDNSAALFAAADALAAAKKSFKKFSDDALAAVPAADDETFWAFCTAFATRWSGRSSDVERACDNGTWGIMNDGGWTLDSWVKAAGILTRYRALKAELSKKCWDLPGLEKGDDSYSDFIDALPLAGRTIVEHILSGGISTYEGLEAVLSGHGRPEMSKGILDGENYVAMKLEEVLLRQLECVAGHVRYEAKLAADRAAVEEMEGLDAGGEVEDEDQHFNR